MFRLISVAFIAGVLMMLSAQADADIIDARCDIYPKGAKLPEGRYLCVLSQYHGYISIKRSDGVNYDFHPAHNAPGLYRDGFDQPVRQRNDLGQKGLIFELNNESIYVYWDTSALSEP
ncbi:hypothetical protein L4174_020215 [Photobacterium sp. CCB-ST2H9]|uniref:hypothetical protein n=1 Tax=unclassified Photobacterium TaxID=2628852 RepID=UPI0020C70FC6|nr:hypothetical protein [Photobacterium sp. CCB-ST2H9]UTM59043.1 hypothetical protein L4174_020215 [Photobacterium sp. CCB-ST2H9]